MLGEKGQKGEGILERGRSFHHQGWFEAGGSAAPTRRTRTTLPRTGRRRMLGWGCNMRDGYNMCTPPQYWRQGMIFGRLWGMSSNVGKEDTIPSPSLGIPTE